MIWKNLSGALLTGGRGGRLGPIAAQVHKALIPVGGRPTLEYSLLALKAAGIKKVFIVLGYRSQDVRRFLADPKFRYFSFRFVDGPTCCPKHSILSLDGRIDGPFALSHTDIIVEKGVFSQLIDACKENSCSLGSIGLSAEPRVWSHPYSTLSDGWITAIRSSLPSRSDRQKRQWFCWQGTYVLDPSSLTVDEDRRAHGILETTWRSRLESKCLRGVVSPRPWFHLANTRDLKAAKDGIAPSILTDYDALE